MLLSDAKAFCDKKNLQFTEPRKKILKLLLKKSKPMGAYAILEALSTQQYQPNPPTIYRAIEFWLKHGFVHKINSLNAYIACAHEHATNQINLLICDVCSQVGEAHVESPVKKLRLNAEWDGFEIDNVITEIHGICRVCQLQLEQCD